MLVVLDWVAARGVGAGDASANTGTSTEVSQPLPGKRAVWRARAGGRRGFAKPHVLCLDAM